MKQPLQVKVLPKVSALDKRASQSIAVLQMTRAPLFLL
jgi:hypothetical protein